MVAWSLVLAFFASDALAAGGGGGSGSSSGVGDSDGTSCAWWCDQKAYCTTYKNDCGECDYCKVTPAPPTNLECKSDCRLDIRGWTEKCKWTICGDCNECKGAGCISDCAIDTRFWSAKCNWNQCKDCNECRPSSGTTPTPPSPSPRPTQSPLPTAKPTESPIPTVTPTKSPVPTGTPTKSPVPTNTPTAAPVPTNTPTESPLPTATPSAAPVPAPVSGEEACEGQGLNEAQCNAVGCCHFSSECWSSVGACPCDGSPCDESGDDENGEEACEGHGYNEDDCNDVGCCHYDGGCWSAVGDGPCDSSEASDSSDDSDMNGEEACEGNGYNEDECNDVGCCHYGDGSCWSAVGDGPCGGGENGETMCEGHGYNEDDCNDVGCCHYDDGNCWSSVGDGPCGSEGDDDDDDGTTPAPTDSPLPSVRPTESPLPTATPSQTPTMTDTPTGAPVSEGFSPCFDDELCESYCSVNSLCCPSEQVFMDSTFAWYCCEGPVEDDNGTPSCAPLKEPCVDVDEATCDSFCEVDGECCPSENLLMDMSDWSWDCCAGPSLLVDGQGVCTAGCWAVTEPCDCVGNCGWSSTDNMCVSSEQSTTGCDECSTLENCVDNTCVEAACPMAYDPNRVCQCTEDCEDYGNCCADAAECKTQSYCYSSSETATVEDNLVCMLNSEEDCPEGCEWKEEVTCSELASKKNKCKAKECIWNKGDKVCANVDCSIGDKGQKMKKGTCKARTACMWMDNECKNKWDIECASLNGQRKPCQAMAEYCVWTGGKVQTCTDKED